MCSCQAIFPIWGWGIPVVFIGYLLASLIWSQIHYFKCLDAWIKSDGVKLSKPDREVLWIGKEKKDYQEDAEDIGLFLFLVFLVTLMWPAAVVLLSCMYIWKGVSYLFFRSVEKRLTTKHKNRMLTSKNGDIRDMAKK